MARFSIMELHHINAIDEEDAWRKMIRFQLDPTYRRMQQHDVIVKHPEVVFVEATIVPISEAGPLERKQRGTSHSYKKGIDPG